MTPRETKGVRLDFEWPRVRNSTVSHYLIEQHPYKTSTKAKIGENARVQCAFTEVHRKRQGCMFFFYACATRSFDTPDLSWEHRGTGGSWCILPQLTTNAGCNASRWASAKMCGHRTQISYMQRPPFNPFTPTSDRCQISPAASPEI